jgi:hypothetical protein
VSRWWLGDPPAPDFEWDSARPVRHPDGTTVVDIVGALNAQLDKILPPADTPRANDPPWGTGHAPEPTTVSRT